MTSENVPEPTLSESHYAMLCVSHLPAGVSERIRVGVREWVPVLVFDFEHGTEHGDDVRVPLSGAYRVRAAWPIDPPTVHAAAAHQLAIYGWYTTGPWFAALDCWAVPVQFRPRLDIADAWAEAHSTWPKSAVEAARQRYADREATA